MNMILQQTGKFEYRAQHSIHAAFAQYLGTVVSLNRHPLIRDKKNPMNENKITKKFCREFTTHTILEFEKIEMKKQEKDSRRIS